MHVMWQDLRYTLRTLAAALGHAALVVVTIALGLAVNVTMFSVINAYMLRPLPVRDPAMLYRLSWSTPSGGVGFFTAREAEAFRAPSAPYADAVSFEPVVATVDGRSAFGNLVSDNYFAMLGVHTMLGRALVAGDEMRGAVPVVVLSHAFWHSRFNADRTIPGRTLQVFGHHYEIAGVAPPGFDGIGQVPADFWIAQAPDRLVPSPSRTIVIRLKSGFSVRQAEAVVLAWAQELTSDRPLDQRVTGVRLQSNTATLPVNAETAAVFASVAGACLFVLLIAAANVANMVLARGLSRQREIGIRTALGAGRSRIARQLLMESVLLTGVAAAAAVLLSRVVLRAAEAWLLATIPPPMAGLVRLVDFSPDVRVFLFLAAASIIAVAVLGVLTVLQATTGDLTSAMRGTVVSDRPSSSRGVLIAGQMTASVLLMICTGVLLQASRRLADSDPQFVTQGVWVVQLNQPVASDVARQLTSHGGMHAASASHAPLTGSLRRLAAGPADGTERIAAGYKFVSPDYFSVLGIPLVHGRGFTQDDAAGDSPVAIVSAATAARLWPNENAVGRAIAIGPTGWQRDRGSRLPRFRTAEVIGVAQDVISGLILEGLDETCVYFPIENGTGTEALLIRSPGDADQTRRALELAVEQSAGGTAIRVTPLNELLAVQIYPFRVASAMAACLGALAMALTLSGTYGVVSFLVGRRRSELGIRMTLGATPAMIVRSVVLESLRPAALGTVAGLVCALTASKLASSYVSTIDAFDLPAYVVAIVIALIGVIVAALVPSCRAVAATNPAGALRSE